MPQKGHVFQDDFDKSFREIDGMSDEDLELLMGATKASPVKSTDFDEVEIGKRVEGTVIETQGDEVLVELDGKTLGVIDRAEFSENEVPPPGTNIKAEFVGYEESKNLCLLSIKRVRTEISWSEMAPGMLVEGIVTQTNKGGLTLDIKGVRAFLPLSQIDRQPVEDVEAFVGKRLRCEILQIDRANKDLVVSRRVILDREKEAGRRLAVQKLQVGDLLNGPVVRLTEHGAFVDLGGVDGLIHANKIRNVIKAGAEEETLKVGQHLEVEVIHIDAERGRVSLDFRRVDDDPWKAIAENYNVGDELTGWISRYQDDGAILAVEEGLEALIPHHFLPSDGADYPPGAVIKGTIVSIDRESQRMTVRPV